MSAINEAVEAVIGIMNGMDLYARVTRGALPTGGKGITCEVGPSSPREAYLDKAVYIPLDLTLNAKHTSIKTLTDTLNDIHHHLTTMRDYPRGEGWRIVDITNSAMPQRMGRSGNNEWLANSALTIKLYLEA